jgi:hypothetical protein
MKIFYDVTNSNFSSVFNSDIKKKSVDEKNEETLPLSRRNTLDKKQTGSVPREKSWVENSQDSKKLRICTIVIMNIVIVILRRRTIFLLEP